MGTCVNLFGAKLLSKESWETPLSLFLQLEIEFGPFDLDPCASPETAKCSQFSHRKMMAFLRTGSARSGKSARMPGGLLAAGVNRYDLVPRVLLKGRNQVSPWPSVLRSLEDPGAVSINDRNF